MGLRYHQPDNEVAFERMCLRFYRKLWKNEGLTLYAKRGEKQHGVDIHDPLCLKPNRAVQCKHHEPTKSLRPAEINEEVRKAEASPFPIEQYVIATTAKKSKSAQNTVVALNARPSTERKFTVEVHFWEDICERLDAFPLIQAEFIVREKDVGDSFLAEILNEPSIAAKAAQVLSAIQGTCPPGAFAEIEQLIVDRNFEVARHQLGKLPGAEQLESLSNDDQYQLLRLRAKLAAEVGEFDSASTYFLAAYERCPNLDQAKHNQVLGYALAPNTTKAYELAAQYIAAGTCNPAMLSRLIENAATLEQIDRHKSYIEPYLASDVGINVALGLKLSQLGDLAGAAVAAERAVTLDPDSPHAQFSAAMRHHNTAFRGGWQDRRLALQKAISHYDTALQAARKGNYAGLMPEILINRAAANTLYGNDSAAAADYREAVAVGDTPAVYAAVAVSAFLHKQDFSAAWDLLATLDTNTQEGCFLATATEFHHTADKAERLKCLQRMKLLAEEKWSRSVECRFHCAQWGLMLKEPAVARACITEEFIASHPFQAFAALAWIDLETGDKDEALKHATEAVRHVTDGIHAQEIRLLAETFVGLHVDETAIDLLERIAVPGLLNEDMMSLINCAMRLERHDLLLRICRELRETGQQDDKLRKSEMRLLSHYAPEQGFALADDFIESSGSPAYFVAYKNVLAVRLNRLEQLRLDSASLPGPKDLAPSEAILVALPYFKSARFDEALRFLHGQLRAFFDDEKAHGNYLSFFLMYGSKTSLGTPPGKVNDGCAVRLKVENAERWVVIESEAPLGSRNEFSERSEFGQRLMDHVVGDVIQLPGAFVREESAVIQEIQTKYVRAFQDCLQHFRERFPETTFVQQVDLGSEDKFDPSPIIQSLKDRRAHVERCVDIYKHNPVPVYLFARSVGISEMEAVVALGGACGRMVRCCETTPQEFDLAATEGAETAAVVLDLSAIITLALVDGWQHLDPSKRYLVSQATKEVVGSWVNEADDERSGRIGYAGVTETGGLAVHETTPEQRAARSAELKRIQKMIEDHSECRASPAVAAIEPVKRKAFEDVIGHHHLEAMSLAKDAGAILWSDDLVISLIAAADFGVQCVWTQLQIKRFTNAGIVSVDDFNSVSCRLVAWHYVNTIWNAETVIKSGELADWDPQKWPFKQSVKLFATLPTSLVERAGLALATIQLLRRSSCNPLRQSPIIQSILTAIGSRDVVLLMRRQLGSIFGLDVVSAAFVQPELDYWLLSHFG
jgi:tetratricopeptide (TPR) repeat protein